MSTEDDAINAYELARAAADALHDKKGERITLRNLSGVSSVTDYSVVASGSSAPHLKALSNAVLVALKDRGCHCYRKAGDPRSGWIVLDYVDAVIHIFEREKRAYYAIEDLWADVPPEVLPDS